MPSVNAQIGPQGPMIDVLLSVSNARRAALASANLPIPAPMSARALIDTGASCTCVDPSVIAHLALTPTGVVPMLTPSTGQTPVMCSQFDLQVGLLHAALTLTIDSVAVTESKLQHAQGFEMLLGRDILSKCVLVYHGDINLYTLSF